MVIGIAKSLPILLLSITFLAPSSVRSDERVDKLSDDYRKWLEQEVNYIITKIEKDIFLDLETREERHRFIQAFWARRDPDPATLENEFQLEHYRRIKHANTVLARDTSRPGWKTERGKYYIMLGKPAEIQNYDGYNVVVSTELWIYRGDPDLGLPPRFNLLFYKYNDIGEYQLYHPSVDGPQAILRAGTAGMYYRVNQHQAVDVLEQVSLDLARATLTIDLTENTGYDMFSARSSIEPLELQVRPAMNVERTLADIEMSATRNVDTRDLEGYERFGHRVTADYSFKFFPSTGVHALLYGPGNVPFLHFGFEIEPSHFTFESDERRTRHYTTVDVDLEVRDLEGRPVAYNLNQPLLQMSASQFKQARSYPFAYRDNYPLVPGDYKVSIVLKNRATKDYTAAEFDLHVPAVKKGKATLSDLVLGYGGEDSLREASTHLSFQVGSMEVYPSAQNTFTISSTVHAFVQAIGVSSGQEIRFQILDSEQKLIQEEKPEAAEGANVQEMALLGFDAGFYTLRAQLVESDGSVLTTSNAPLTVSPRNEVVRPAFIYRHSFNTDVPGFLDMTLGNQLMVAGRIEEGQASFEKAVAANNPQLPMARWRLAGIVLYARDAERAIELLAPLEKDFPNEYEVIEGLGFAYYIKEDYARAKDYLEHSSTIRAPDTSALNALGDCYERLEETAKAKQLYQRSLELNPEQEGVKARLAGLSGGG